MKNFLILALVLTSFESLCAVDNGLQGNKVQIGAWSRFKKATYNVARMPVDATVWCVSKTYDYTKKTAFFVYKTADKMVYVVGLTTTGFLIYCYFNGKLEQVITVDQNHNQYWWEFSGIPFFKEIKIGLPEVFADFCLVSQEHMEQLQDKIGITVQALHEKAGDLKKQADQALEAAKNAISQATRETLERTGSLLNNNAAEITDIAEGLAQ